MPSVLVTPGALSEAERALREMAEKDRWLGELAMRVSAGGMKLVADEFNTSTDPYGKPWAPLKRWRPRDIRAARRRASKGQKVRGPMVLVHTGRMRGSVGASPSGRTAKVVLPTWYARFHNEGVAWLLNDAKFNENGENIHPEGGMRLPKRQILPDNDRLPEKWDTMIEKEAKGFMFQRFGVR